MSSAADIKRLNAVLAKVLDGMKPPEDVTVTEWAEKHRKLSSESSAEVGTWRTSRTPYLREPMNAFCDPKIHHLVMVAASQVGKSELMNNCMGYIIDCDPGSILFIQPTTVDAKEYSKLRIRLLGWTLYLHTGKAHNQRKRLYNNRYRPQDTGGILMADEVTRLRIGTVSAVDKANLAARVIFKDENIVSGWLPVLQRSGEIVTVATAGKHDHDVDGDCTVKNTTKTPTTWTDSEGKVHTSYETAHSHGAKVNYWLPKVNETVACLYLPTFNGDGVILGAIKT